MSFQPRSNTVIPLDNGHILMWRVAAITLNSYVLCWRFGVNKKPLTIVGDGNQSRDFVYVTDVARAFLAAAKTNYVGKIYNVGNGNPQTVNYLASLIGGRKVFIPDRPGEPRCSWANINKIKRELKWKPKIKFKEGINKMMNEIQQWKDAPLWTPKSIKFATKTWFKFLSKKNNV